MASPTTLALGNECYTQRDSMCLQSLEDILGRFPSAPSKKQNLDLSRQAQRPQEKKWQHGQTGPVIKDCATARPSLDWKMTLREIKSEYMNTRFRQCSLRCHEVLALGDKLDQEHTVYHVYVRFYAATALEMQARALHHSSPFRLSLLKQAHNHYSIASDLASQANQKVGRSPSSARSSTFSLPSLHSRGGSNVSASTASTRMSSPSPSLGSPNRAFKPMPKKKKVSFCDEPMIEPIIRPDSPTLGFDEWLGRSSPEPVFPESILKSTKHMPAAISPSDDGFSTSDLSDMEAEDADPFFQTRSIHRFCTILSGIQRQITSHMTALDREMAACQVPTAPALISPEMKILDIQARIKRLRACGWKRARFDVQRHQTVRENALADMAE